MRSLYAFLVVFAPWVLAGEDKLPTLENIVEVKLEVSCLPPYVAIVHFHNRFGEPLRLSRVYIDPAGYWNDNYFTINLGKALAKSKMINSLHYQSRVMEDISVVLPAGGVLKSIINLDQHYIIPDQGFDRVRYSALWSDVTLGDGSKRWISVASEAFRFEDHCTREQPQ